MDIHLLNQIETASPVRTVDRLDELDAIFDDDVDAVIWNRGTPPAFAPELADLPSHDVAGGLFRVAPGEAGARLRDLFDDWGWRARPAHDWLAGDVDALLAQLARLFSADRFNLRVELVRDDACRKFHRDTLRSRLICTYTGPGTEFGLSDCRLSDCRFSDFGPSDESGRPGQVETVPTGGPILMKGKCWTPAAKRTIVHRSPPIEHAGLSRLVVVLDPASA